MDFDQLQLKSELNDLKHELARFRRRQRRTLLLIWPLLAIAIGAVAVFDWYQRGRVPTGDVIVARRFVLRDRFGSVKAELIANDTGTELALYGPVGSEGAGAAARLVVGQNRSMLLLDGSGKRLITAVP